MRRKRLSTQRDSPLKGLAPMPICMPYVPLHVVREHAADESEGRQQQVRVVSDIGVLQHHAPALNALLTIRILFSLGGVHLHE
eukprot:3945174-Pyramimonas_sp.AAC.1